MNFNVAVELHLLVEGTDNLLLVHDLEHVVALDVSGGNNPFLLDIEGEDTWLFAVSNKFNLLEIQHDVGDIFDNSGKSGEFVLHTGDPHGCDGSAFQ